MLSVPAATELLTRATNAGRLAAIASELRFGGRPEELTSRLREKLSLPAEVIRARVERGPGALRALIIELAERSSQRDTLARLATALWSNSPHSLWLVLGCIRGGASVFLAAWLVHNGRPQIRALSVDRHHVYASDAETLCALASACEGPDLLVHTRWTETLGRDALTRRFYSALSGAVKDLAEDLPRDVAREARGDLALLNTSRLLFLAFLQTKGWLNGDHGFLQNLYERGIEAGGRIHARILEPLFFGTLNTRPAKRQARARAFGRIPYLNGGLFARAPLERRHRGARVSDETLGRMFTGLLSRYRFTPVEESADWSDAAVDPVILGRAFESLMDQTSRKTSGTYYTPPEIVERATKVVLQQALADSAVPPARVTDVLDGNTVPPGTAATLLKRVRALRVLDPACGSGAFLIHALRVLADLRVHLGSETRSEARRAVLASSIFGVDVSPTAVWLCELRLWLALAVESHASDPLAVPPLPNLDRNIRIGDSLAGPAFASDCASRKNAALTRLRARYTRAQGQRKRTLARALDSAERHAALAAIDMRLATLREMRRDLILGVRSQDLFGERRAGARVREELRRLRLETRVVRAEREKVGTGAALAFSFDVQFADVAEAGGFDAIIGNPPWIRPHRLPKAARAALRTRFRVCRTGVPRGNGPSDRLVHGFGTQVDLAAPFVERAFELLCAGGALALLVPSKLWSSQSGGSLRAFALSAGEVLSVEDFTAAGRLFEAAAYPSLIALAKPVRQPANAKRTVRIVIHRRGAPVEWSMPESELRFGGDQLAPWLLVPPHVRRAFERLASAGEPLAQSRFGPPRLGVKTGCNAGFLVRVSAQGESLAEIRSEDRHGWVERALLRPVLRGEFVRPWHSVEQASERIIWTHDHAGRPLERLPPHAAAWLRQWRRELAARTDARPRSVWWELFRTPAARCDRHRVVWCDIGRSPRACVVQPGDPLVPLNTCYVAFADEADSLALAALLNGPLTSAWLNVLAEPARGGYRRYFAWTMAALPVPPDENAFRDILAPLAKAASAGAEPTPSELLDAALAAYRVRKSDIAALLEWHDV